MIRFIEPNEDWKLKELLGPRGSRAFKEAFDFDVTRSQAQGPPRRLTSTGAGATRRVRRAPAVRESVLYRGASLMRPPPPVGPYSSPMPRDLW